MIPPISLLLSLFLSKLPAFTNTFWTTGRPGGVCVENGDCGAIFLFTHPNWNPCVEKVSKGFHNNNNEW